jgi:hypothetical protein
MAAGLEAMVRDSGKPMAVWNPREVAAQNVNGECSGHKNRTYPEAPVTMHTPPVGTGAGSLPSPLFPSRLCLLPVILSPKCQGGSMLLQEL